MAVTGETNKTNKYNITVYVYNIVAGLKIFYRTFYTITFFTIAAYSIFFTAYAKAEHYM